MFNHTRTAVSKTQINNHQTTPAASAQYKPVINLKLLNYHLDVGRRCLFIRSGCKCFVRRGFALLNLIIKISNLICFFKEAFTGYFRSIKYLQYELYMAKKK